MSASLLRRGAQRVFLRRGAHGPIAPAKEEFPDPAVPPEYRYKRFLDRVVGDFFFFFSAYSTVCLHSVVEKHSMPCRGRLVVHSVFGF
jgi:hypothetical protein